MRQPLAKARKKGNPKGLKRSPPPLGKSHYQQITPKILGRNVELFERQGRAVRMANAGASFEQIAQALGYSDKGDAHRDVMAALAEARKICAVEIESYRDLRLAELNALRVRVRAMIEQKDVDPKVLFAGVDKIVKIQEREAKFLGLDAPVRSELTGVGGRPIEIDIRSLSREQLVRLAAGDTSVLFPVGGAAVGEGPASPGGENGVRGSNPGDVPPN